MKTVAIMQPTYLPWIGYFAMMDAVDAFVLLDTVAFDRRSWQQRNRIRGPEGPMWLTVPVESKGRRGEPIDRVRIDRSRDFARRHRRAIEASYAKAPHFPGIAGALFELIERDCERLVELTVPIVEWLRARLGVATPLLSSASLAGAGDKAELLASLCQTLGATRYLSPPSARDYLDAPAAQDAFARRGIEIVYFDYRHPTYEQGAEPFEPYLSVVDLLFHAGPASAAVMRSGIPAHA